MSSKLGKIVADFRTSLATKISVGGTTASLQSNLDDDGIALPDGTYFFTIDGDSSQKEHIVATNTGGNLTDIKSISRQGVQTAGVKREHRVGAAVTITDFAHIKYLNDLLDGTTDLDGSKPLKYDIDPTISDDKHLATKKYVGDAFSGVVGTASSTVSGTTKLSSDPVTPNNPVALNSEEVSATSGANKVPKANANGLIDSGFIIDNAADSGLEEGANGGTKVKVKTTGGILIDADGLSVDTGTTANKLVRLDGDAKLPAVDGSQLTNVRRLQRDLIFQGVNFMAPMSFAFTVTPDGNTLYSSIPSASSVTRTDCFKRDSDTGEFYLNASSPTLGGSLPKSVVLLGNYVFVFASSSSYRYNKDTMQNATSLSFSGGEAGNKQGAFTDGVYIYMLHSESAGVATYYKYSVSGTTLIKEASSITFSSVNSNFVSAFFYNTNVYIYSSSSSSVTGSMHKYALSGGSPTAAVLVNKLSYGGSLATYPVISASGFVTAGSNSYFCSILLNDSAPSLFLRWFPAE